MGRPAFLPLHHTINDDLGDYFVFFVRWCVDKIPIFSRNAEENQQHLDLVHYLLQQHQLFPCINKSTCFQPQVLFCGYIIDSDRLHMESEKVKVMQGGPAPTTVHEVRQLIGVCGFYAEFVEVFQAMMAPPTMMFKADSDWE